MVYYPNSKVALIICNKDESKMIIYHPFLNGQTNKAAIDLLMYRTHLRYELFADSQVRSPLWHIIHSICKMF